MKSKRFFSGPIPAILVLTAILVTFFSVEFIRLKNQGPQATLASNSTAATTAATTETSAIAATPGPATETVPAVTSAAAPTGTTTTASRPPDTHATTGATTTRIAVRLITPEQAQVIAMDEIGKNAKLLSIKSELDNHPPKYDVTLTMGGYVYELEIHAVTGAIIDFEKDPMDDRDETRPH